MAKEAGAATMDAAEDTGSFVADKVSDGADAATEAGSGAMESAREGVAEAADTVSDWAEEEDGTKHG
jgi:hypothetical protein